MKLTDLYQSLSREERKALADSAGIDPGYLWQIATGWRGKRPSVDVIARLIRADQRLKATELVDEFADHPARTARERTVTFS